jgi:hypothetical protein
MRWDKLKDTPTLLPQDTSSIGLYKTIMTNFTEDPSDFLLTLLIECLDSKFQASEPSISAEELEALSVSPATAVENIPGILDELSQRPDELPPLHCDAFWLPKGSTCSQLAQKAKSLPEDALGLAVSFFKAMESYPNYLNIDADNLTKADRSTHELQLEVMREQINLATLLHQQHRETF